MRVGSSTACGLVGNALTPTLKNPTSSKWVSMEYNGILWVSMEINGLFRFNDGIKRLKSSTHPLKNDQFISKQVSNPHFRPFRSDLRETVEKVAIAQQGGRNENLTLKIGQRATISLMEQAHFRI